MDPVTLAAAALSVVGPYLVKIAGKAAQGLADSVSDDAVEFGRKMWKRIRQAFAGSATDDVAARAEKDPNDADTLEIVKHMLIERLKSDPALASDLEGLVKQAEQSGVVINATDAGMVVGGNVTQTAQRDIIGRDQINVNREPDN
jgi:hypothetical protein